MFKVKSDFTYCNLKYQCMILKHRLVKTCYMLWENHLDGYTRCI